jgi:nuclear transport factor 2 (NTF2) superfamily protein
MNFGFTPPLSFEKATSAVKIAEGIWNKADLDEVAALFHQNCEWRDNHRHIKGREAILKYLKEKERGEVQYKVRARLWSHSFFRLAVSFQSEWRHTSRPYNYRTSGHIFIVLDNYGLAKEFCISSFGRAVRVNETGGGESPGI